MDNRARLRSGKALVYALLLVVALAGTVGEGGRRLAEVVQWRGGAADSRGELLYGPYRELFTNSFAQLPPNASILLMSDWDPALIPYYLDPRKIFQLGVDPETNAVFMKLPPSPYPRRRPESFAVDLIVTLRNVQGAMVPEIWDVRASNDEGSENRP